MPESLATSRRNSPCFTRFNAAASCSTDQFLFRTWESVLFLCGRLNIVNVNKINLRFITICSMVFTGARRGWGKVAASYLNAQLAFNQKNRGLFNFLILMGLQIQINMYISVTVFTARVAKRAKVMFLQVFVILSPNGGGGRWATLMFNHLPPPQDETRSEHLPPPPRMGPGLNIYAPPPQDGTRSEHLPHPPKNGTRSEHLPPPTRTMHRRAVRILLECILVIKLNDF